MLGVLQRLRLANQDAQLVFTKPDGSVIDATKLASRVFRKAQIKAGVPIINFHGLRHTYASHYMMNGGSLYDLKALLGHSTIDVTQRYAHLSLESLQKTRSLVNFEIGNLEKFPENSRQNHATKASNG